MLVICHKYYCASQVAGLPTNISFLQKLANHWAFESGQVETHFIEHFKNDLFVDSTDAIAEETSNAAKLGASLAAACVCRQEQLALKDNFHGNLDKVLKHIYFIIFFEWLLSLKQNLDEVFGCFLVRLLNIFILS